MNIATMKAFVRLAEPKIVYFINRKLFPESQKAEFMNLIQNLSKKNIAGFRGCS